MMKARVGALVTEAKRAGSSGRALCHRLTVERLQHPKHPTMRGLYAIVDPGVCAGRDPLKVAQAILSGGCAMLQLRSKHLADRALLDLARPLAELCRSYEVPFVVNDRVDIALLCGADGVHVGQEDIPVAELRRLAPDLSLGVSTHSPSQAQDAQAEGAALVGYGPVFATLSKVNPDPVVGLASLASVVRGLRIPAVAIGGITLDNIDAVVATGVPLVCAIGAVVGSPDPAKAAEALHRRIAAGV
jgi:thiamine-phosphate pyrophosphorylase